MEFGSTHYVLLDSYGSLYGAGTNTNKQYYPGNVSTTYEWVHIADEVDDVWCGARWTCYKKGGKIYFIGTNGLTSATFNVYTEITSQQLGSVLVENIVGIYGTEGMMHIALNNGQLYAIGANTNANSGLNTASTAITSMTLVSGLNGTALNTVDYIRYAQDGSALLKMKGGYLYGWGKNTSGLLANANQTAIGTPKTISFAAVGVTVGYSAMTYMVSSGVWSCGDQVYGQTGTGYIAGSSNYITSIVKTNYASSLVAPFISPKGTKSWQNCFISSTGLWITGLNPTHMGATSTGTLGAYTNYPIPVSVGDIADYGFMAGTSTICTKNDIYQCGSGARIIGNGTGTVIGFTKVRLPWE